MTEDEICDSLRRALCESGLCAQVKDLAARVKLLEDRAVPARKPESYEEVKEEFQRKGGGFGEAEKFYNYYQMVGWVTTSKLPIKDWRKAVSQWISRNGGKVEDRPVKKKPYQNQDFWLGDDGTGTFVKFKIVDGKRTRDPFRESEWRGE